MSDTSDEKRLALPYPPLVIVACNGPLSDRRLGVLVADRPKGLSICLQTEDGHPQRGGFFFHIAKSTNGFVFRTFDREDVARFDSLAHCVRFINHVSGREYDEAMWRLSQKVNLRTDANLI